MKKMAFFKNFPTLRRWDLRRPNLEELKTYGLMINAEGFHDIFVRL
jgi:hypothetical protein